MAMLWTMRWGVSFNRYYFVVLPFVFIKCAILHPFVLITSVVAAPGLITTANFLWQEASRTLDFFSTAGYFSTTVLIGTAASMM
jgi:hypothetical protein